MSSSGSSTVAIGTMAEEDVTARNVYVFVITFYCDLTNCSAGPSCCAVWA